MKADFKDGRAEILLHIGIDTVKLNGENFDIHVKQGDKVKVGDIIADVNFEGIEKAGYKTITPIVVTNTDEYTEIKMTTTGKVTIGDKIISVK